MRLCFAQPGVRRTWTVELCPQPDGPVLVCRQCAHRRRPLHGPSARAEVLAHLALHARRDVLPTHLRTCQCHERGCGWHPRHRGCHGPIRLLLARECGGRIWRLTDACTACAAATAQAAVVPETILAPGASSTRQVRRGRSRRPRGPGSRTRVREMLNYLAASLPAEASAASRLISLQCALRMNDWAQVCFPQGLLRSLRLGTAADPLRELNAAQWLRTISARPGSGKHVVVVQLLDSGLLGQCPARPDRLRAADWALRTASSIRNDPAPLPRLVALCLAAHTAPGEERGTAEAEHLARECGVAATMLPTLFDHLSAVGVLSGWSTGSVPGDVQWALEKWVVDQ